MTAQRAAENAARMIDDLPLSRVAENVKLKALTRRARTEIRQAKKAAEVQARREGREERRNSRERDRRLKREQRETRAAGKLARRNAPLPQVEAGPERLPNWAELRGSRVTVLENGQCVRRSWAELSEE